MYADVFVNLPLMTSRIAGQMILQTRHLAAAAVQAYPDVLQTKHLEVVVACCAAFPPAFMETLTSQTELKTEQQYVETTKLHIGPS